MRGRESADGRTDCARDRQGLAAVNQGTSDKDRVGVVETIRDLEPSIWALDSTGDLLLLTSTRFTT